MINTVKEFFISHNKKCYSFDELHEIFKDYTVEELGKALSYLEESFFIMHNKNNEFGILSLFNLIYGTLSMKHSLYGFIDGEDNHLYVPYEKLSSAMDKDICLASITTFKGKEEAHIERIIKRSHNKYYGKVIIFRKKKYLKVFENIVIGDLLIDESESIKFNIGDYVECIPLKYTGKLSAIIKVVKVYGNDSNHSLLDLKMIKEGYNLPESFDNDVLNEANLFLKEDLSNELNKRINLTNKYIVTIDSESAKDFDDAVSVYKNSDNTYELGVYIADVSHYVKDDSLIDLEALNRTTSIYLPNEVIPMLPSVLSDNLCSLQQDKIRLVISLIMNIDSNGNILDYDLKEGFIKSSHRLTYEGVNKYLNNDLEYLEKYQDIKDFIIPAVELSNILHKKRLKDGAFNFESTESVINLDSNGDCINVLPIKRGISENIIEEFMITANSCIAEIFNYSNFPFIYRVHQTPDDEKIISLINKINSFGYNYKVKGKDLSYVLKEVITSLDEISIDESLKAIINNEIIRSFPKAIYSTTNISHFGLALKNYTHFTSPIRRYPDLMVHRMIKRCFIHPEYDTKSLDYYENKLTLAANQSSKNERIAENIERDIDKYYYAMYLSHHIGEVFTATISSITSFGIYSSLDNYIEGLTKYVDMKGYIEYNEETSSCYNEYTKESYHLGDKILIKVKESNPIYREIDFSIIKRII